MDAKQDPFYKLLKAVLRIYKFAGITLVLVAFLVLAFNMSPQFLKGIDDNGLANASDNQLLISPVEAESLNTNVASLDRSHINTAHTLPPKDSSLPKTPTLRIDKIGVNGIVRDSENGEADLEKGIWRDPKLGNPKDGIPVVLASHRFGYSYWSQDFRTANSFYNLPKLEVGDTITYIWDQRAFNYRITRIYETQSTFTVDSALVLYTCKFFNNETRIVVEAELY